MQAAYEEFGCNDGNVFFLGIDKGNTNADVLYYDSVYGVQYPGVSGQEGGGNDVHWTYDVQATPSIVVILPDKSIIYQQIYPPTFGNVADSVLSAGGIQQECLTSMPENPYSVSLSFLQNPVSDKGKLYFALDEGKEIEFRIFSITGQPVWNSGRKNYPPGSNFLEVDVKSFPEGFYLVQMISGTQIHKTAKLAIRR